MGIKCQSTLYNHFIEIFSLISEDCSPDSMKIGEIVKKVYFFKKEYFY